MERETSVELDLDTIGESGRRQDIARIFVSHARSFTRHAGAPVLTEDCTSAASLEGEVERVKAELDSAVEAARAHFEGREPAPREPTASEEAVPAPEKARIDLGLFVEDVMTRDVKTVRANDHLSLVDELMRVGRFRHVVVLDDEARVVGVISQRDIFLGALAWSIGQGARAHRRALEATPAKDVMRADPVTIDPETPLAEAAVRMAEQKIGCLPVLHSGELVGILTEGDFLALLSRS